MSLTIKQRLDADCFPLFTVSANTPGMSGVPYVSAYAIVANGAPLEAMQELAVQTLADQGTGKVLEAMREGDEGSFFSHVVVYLKPEPFHPGLAGTFDPAYMAEVITFFVALNANTVFYSYLPPKDGEKDYNLQEAYDDFGMSLLTTFPNGGMVYKFEGRIGATADSHLEQFLEGI